MLYFATWKTVLILLVCAVGAAFAAPNLLDRRTAESIPSWLPHRQISLGLDLQGGSHLLLEVDTRTVIRESLETTVDAVRAALREARIRYSGLGVEGTAVVVNVTDAERRDEARELLRKIDRSLELTVDEGGQFALRMTEQAVREREMSAVEKSVEIIRRRIDETGVREPTIQPQGARRVLVQLPGIEDPARMKNLIGKTAKMTFHLVDLGGSIADAQAGRVPPGTELLPDAHETDVSGRPTLYLVKKRVVVSGENLIDAQPTFQQNQPVVSFRFDTLGAKRFGDATTDNVGQLLAIVLDGKVISAPRIREPILGGNGIISGSFTVESAKDLALLLRAGALPAPLTVIEERSVGPGLGSDSVAAGELAAIVAVVLVIALMVFCYGFFGVLANVALLVNLVLLLGLMSALQATLTLPGIAGIVLTMGMAVDANVLIFEHVREELRRGRTPISALDAGFTRALVTIVDSNLTTLFASVALFLVGSGPVRGFAVTLSLGLFTSMFTAVTFTRLMVVGWLRYARPKALRI